MKMFTVVFATMGALYLLLVVVEAVAEGASWHMVWQLGLGVFYLLFASVWWHRYRKSSGPADVNHAEGAK